MTPDQITQAPGHLTPMGAELKRRSINELGRPVCDLDIVDLLSAGYRPTLADFEHAQASLDMGATCWTTKAELLAWIEVRGEVVRPT